MSRKGKTGRLRISGVVKAMNTARHALANGIPKEEAAGFRRWILETTREVERICRVNGVKPDQLPAPTYRAYQYLKSLDLKDLPSPDQGGEPQKTQAPTLRISNLVSNAEEIQQQLSQLALSLNPAKEMQALRARIQDLVRRVEEICRESQASPGDLPAPSRRAYQWLHFLGQAENLQAHLASLRQIQQLAGPGKGQASCYKQLPAAVRDLPLQARFTNLSALYRVKTLSNGVHLTANEGFINASRLVLQALLCAALTHQGEPYLAEIRRYASGQDFIEITLAMELAGEAAQGPARGQVFDLDRIYDQVNQEYFQGKLKRPRLTWNRTLTHRKLGHYQPSTDTVLVSITLDQAHIPPWVVEYVVYHELLHKHLGVQFANGRYAAHTPAFRKEERKFRRFGEVQEFLKDPKSLENF